MGNGVEDVMELMESFQLKSVQRRTHSGGAWVKGTIGAYRFDALVFPEPAMNRSWEVNGDSRISKLWIQRLNDRREVYNWDRGADREPADDVVAAIVDLLSDGLAESIFGN